MSATFPSTTNGSASTNTTSSSAADSATVTVQSAKNSLVDSEVYGTAAYNAVANHPAVQNVKDTVANGPVAENAKEQAAKTQNEFSNLAAARTTPAQPTATGQQLTHYHSFFSSLLSWENPRASAIAYVSLILLIFGARYLNLLRYAFKLTWMTLGVTVAAEIAGKLLFSQGLATQIRPRKYYVLPRETIDSVIGDVHELINFFIIESQRIVFAENVFASASAFIGAFISYFLIKIVPFWGLSLIFTTVAFLAPLLYISNQELIDHHVRNASNVVNQQTEQIKQVASYHASVAAKTTQQYASGYTAKAQEMVGVKSSRQSSPEVATKPIKTEPTSNTFAPAKTAGYKHDDFPVAPKEDILNTNTVPKFDATTSTLVDEKEPLLAL